MKREEETANERMSSKNIIAAPMTALVVDENIVFAPRRSQEPLWEPEVGELLIETLFSGTNPADAKHATLLGIYPAVLGYDFCGKVLKSYPESTFREGDIVAGYTPTGVGRARKYGTHQNYLICPEEMAFLVPSGLPREHAACLSVVTMTAADALYNLFKLPLPSHMDTPKSDSSKSLLIWGASSSVGMCAIQLARASGVHPIFVTASPQRHTLLQELGATRCFDYRSPHVIADIQQALVDFKVHSLDYGFDAVGSHGDLNSADRVAKCASDETKLASVVIQQDSRFKMPFATSNQEVILRVTGVPHPISIPARRSDYQHAWKAFQWAVQNYGALFKLPVVEVFKGSADDALKEVMSVGEGRGFGKLAIQHPLL
ncbi:alcohol dehydrogenase [Penicillium odoratum]|uniref:alcohol dehydrogenase n=1 Tax=Penicillium odoratum TaxID=1167516 RepID=UPI0025494DB3|nr:alcohol dehydrogenase [Penicillium odoratum]KAJ5769002.1 alcohol dehydrogenase [Penicillium odoratum]